MKSQRRGEQQQHTTKMVCMCDGMIWRKKRTEHREKDRQMKKKERRKSVLKVFRFSSSPLLIVMEYIYIVWLLKQSLRVFVCVCHTAVAVDRAYFSRIFFYYTYRCHLRLYIYSECSTRVRCASYFLHMHEYVVRRCQYCLSFFFPSAAFALKAFHRLRAFPISLCVSDTHAHKEGNLCANIIFFFSPLLVLASYLFV